MTNNGYTSTPYVLNDGVLDRPEVTGGTLLTNRDELHHDAYGFQFTMNKRLSNKWMARGSFSFNSLEDNIGPYSF